MPTSVLRNKSPFETLFHQPPDYGFLRTFGCLCFPFLRPYNAHKLDYRSTPCVFLGYSSCHLGYRCLDLSSDRIYISRHVRFHENSFPFIESTRVPATTNSNPQPAPISCLPALTSFPSSNPPQTSILSSHTSVPLPPSATMSLDHFAGSDSAAADITATESPPSTMPPTSPSQVPASSSQVPTESSPGLDLCIDLSSYSIPQQSPPIRSPDSPAAVASRHHPMVLRPRQHKSVNVSSVSASPLPPNLQVTYSSAHEPLSFREADRFLCWHSAMESEITALHANDTRSLVLHEPSMNVVGCRWVYKIKRRADGTVERYKAHLVARGFSQQEGIDYSKTFSPVVKPTTVHLVLAIAVSNCWQIRQLDVHNAFLNGSLQEVVYMQQPTGFVDPAMPTHVCRLHKSPYGLKQAPRAWYKRLSDFLLSVGFRVSKVDTSLFILKVNHDICYLLVYVDEILLIGSNSSLLQSLITLLSS